MLARAREVHELADLVGRGALSATDTRYLACEAAFQAELLDQERGSHRTLPETLDRAWAVLGRLPRRELTMLTEQQLGARYRPVDGGGVP